jgi:hypothetical protein
MWLPGLLSSVPAVVGVEPSARLRLGEFSMSPSASADLSELSLRCPPADMVAVALPPFSTILRTRRRNFLPSSRSLDWSHCVPLDVHSRASCGMMTWCIKVTLPLGCERPRSRNCEPWTFRVLNVACHSREYPWPASQRMTRSTGHCIAGSEFGDIGVLLGCDSCSAGC